MSGDPARDASSRLRELEATVRGLTRELVSTNERLRELEAALEEQGATTDGGTDEDGTDRAGRATRATPAEDQDQATPASDEAAAEGERDDLDDIIVA